MSGGIFVTGTDTNAGKTVVAALLVHWLRRHVPVRYWKPIQTGIEQDNDTAEVCRLTAALPEEILDEGVRLRRPVSPHVAARLSGCQISLSSLVHSFKRNDSSRRWIVEGAGGVLVPVNNNETMADLMVQLGLPALVVARTSLGTINHTLMTVEVLRHRFIDVAGVVMVGHRNDDARRAIEDYGGVEVLGELPLFNELTCEALAASSRKLDPTGRLVARIG